MRWTMGKVVLVAVGCLHAAGAFAQGEETDAERFRRRVARYAPAVDRPARGVCVCQDGSANHGRAGELRQVQVLQVFVTCAIPAFNGAGGFSAFDTCGVFVPLSR